MPTFAADNLRGFIERSLGSAGLNDEEARRCADAAIFANLRGTDTHGIVYILPRMLRSIAEGKTVTGARMVVANESPGSALLRANGVAGPLLGYQAMGMAVEKARTNGVASVVTINGGPLGMIGYYAALAAQRGCFGMVMANTSPSVAPHGSSERVFGTNPFAYAAPAADGPMVLLDIATSMAASGKLAGARRRGEPLPEGWVVDSAGEWITDAARAGEGAMLAFGEHKGSGIALLVHLLTGALGGTTVGGELTHENADPDIRGQSTFYLAIDPAHFASRATFEALVERQRGYIDRAAPLPGVERVLTPGERGAREAVARRARGIPISEGDWKAVLDAIEKAGLPTAELTRALHEVA